MHPEIAGRDAETPPPERRAPDEPLSSSELARSLARPDLAAVHVLGSPERIARTATGDGTLWPLIALLSVVSLVMALPYGALTTPNEFWNIAVLFTGSLLICVPSLLVFLQFLGSNGSLLRDVSFAFMISATAGFFTLGFAPIIWFIDLTTNTGDGSLVTPRRLSAFLLALSLALGIVQMTRCLRSSSARERLGGRFLVLIFVWIGLLVFIVWRMAGELGLRG